MPTHFRAIPSFYDSLFRRIQNAILF
jgi:hypothetical protein